MPSPERRTGWRAQLGLHENPYSESDLELIAAVVQEVLECPLSPSERDRLLAHVQSAARAFSKARELRKGPTPGEIRAALGGLRDAADKLLKDAEGLDDATAVALLRQRGEFNKAFRGARGQSLSPGERCVRALSIVSALYAEANAAIRALDNPRPPSAEDIMDTPAGWVVDPVYRGKNAVKLFIGWLADIFHEIAKQEPECRRDPPHGTYVGDFLRFTKACLEPLENGERAALGRTIQEALREWRKRRDEKAEAEAQDGEDEGTE